MRVSVSHSFCIAEYSYSSSFRHGRDYKLHVWSSVKEAVGAVGSSAASPDLRTPELMYSMDVNAHNYCRFSLLAVSTLTSDRALIALPNVVESSVVRMSHIVTHAHHILVLTCSSLSGRHMDNAVSAKATRSDWKVATTGRTV